MPISRTGAGSLDRRIAFDRRMETSDEYGGVEAEWVEGFVVAASVTPRLGGETVMAARLAGTAPVTIMVRRSVQTAAVTSAWRARDVRSGETYNIRSIAAVGGARGRYIEMLAESGVPA
ncbi:hypothetical protein RHODGE_RHODGE_02828 [Rhodoplanes serenus]|uniref:Head-tail adaptor protein n=1 Tax=Rhodoplanes serenus TaxID=200615 RepID=A0A3S5CYG6_9BRAD|nr:head-tail adaptor protein [Rhodoplanes serenus]VCU09659.1 hypothetical protein RHODGE_RHODGE_02828 [Rhodoplanes serenus]